MVEPKHWLVGAHFDLYGSSIRALATKGADGKKLTDDEVRRLCSSLLHHAERHDVILTKLKRIKAIDQ